MWSKIRPLRGQKYRTPPVVGLSFPLLVVYGFFMRLEVQMTASRIIRPNQSLGEMIAALPSEQRAEIFAGLEPKLQAELAYSWELWGRPDQQTPEGYWNIWLIQAGRGWGKSRTGAEAVRRRVELGLAGRIALIGPTAADCRDVMVEGESGLLAIAPPHNRPKYEPSKRKLSWPNGAIAMTYSAEESERLRGPQHDFGWGDELASWKDSATWDMYQFGLRLGKDPKTVLTGTPKPVPLIRTIRALPGTVITYGRTKDNAKNLAAPFLKAIMDKYEGTRLGRQELDGELLTDVIGALWTDAMFTREGFRIDADPVAFAQTLKRVVVGVDPAASSSKTSDETGIVVAGVDHDGGYYLLADFSLQGTPLEWATEAIKAFKLFGADRIIVERNNGGEMVASTIRTVFPDAPITTVWASKGKATRAEPIAALYEQNRVQHIGKLPILEQQQVEWVPGDGDSPDRVDAAVWALHELSQGFFDIGIG